MSFGGGTTQYILEYIVKVTNQGGAATSGPLNQLNASTQQVTQSTTQLTASQEKLRVAHERVTQAGLGVSKAAKGMAFGFIGIATAGAEAVGMLSMYQQTQAAVTEAQAAQSAALKEGGKNTKDYKDATNELVKAQRWQRMTQRNLMLSLFDLVPFIVLSVNGILKLRTALKMAGEAKAAENAIKALGVSMKGAAVGNAAMNAAAANTGITLSKFGKGAVIAQGATMKFSKATIGSVAAFSAADAAMLKNASSMKNMEGGTTKLAKAFRILGIAMKIAIPLVILEIASQAFQNNWGGFADKVNALGKAFGDAVPQAKGFLDIIGKVGRSVVAIFTGNFEDIGKIWADQQKAMEDTSPTEKQRKAAEELKKAYEELRDESMQFLQEIGNMEKKSERKDALKKLGFSGDTLKDMDKWMKNFAKMQNTLDDFRQSVEMMDTLNIMQKFGFDVPNNAWKNVAKNFSKAFSNMGKMFPGDDVFDQFAEVLDKASKKKGPAVVAAIMAFTKSNPNFMPMLSQMNPALYSALQTFMQNNGGALQVGLDAAIADLKWDKITADTGIKKGSFLTDAILGTGDTTTPGTDTPEGATKGIFDKIIETIKTGMTDIKTAITGANWNALGVEFRTQILKIFTPANAQWLGGQIKALVIAPLISALNGVFGEFMAQMKKDPVGTIIGVTTGVGAISAEFIAGLLGYPSKEHLFADIVYQANQIVQGNPVLYLLVKGDWWGALVEAFKEGATAGPTLATAQAQMDATPGASIMDKIGMTAFLQQQWIKLLAELAKNPTVIQINQFANDPLGWIWAALVDNIKIANKPVAAPQIESNFANPQTLANIGQGIIDAWNSTLEYIANLPVVQGIADFFADPLGGIITTVTTVNKNAAKSGVETNGLADLFSSWNFNASDIAHQLDIAVGNPIREGFNIFAVELEGVINTAIAGINTVRQAFHLDPLPPVKIPTLTLTPVDVEIDMAAVKKALANNAFNNIDPNSGASAAGSFNQAEGNMRKGGGPELSIPSVTLKPKAAVVNINDVQGGSIGGCGAMGGGFGGLGGCQLPMDSVTVAPKITYVSTSASSVQLSSGGFGNTTGSRFNGARTSSSGSGPFAAIPIPAVTVAPETVNIDTSASAATFTDLSAMAQVSADVVAKAFSKMGKQVNKILSAMSSHANDMLLNIAKASSKSANTVAKNYSSGAKKTNKIFSALSSHWNDMALNIAKASSKSANLIAKNFGSGITKAGKAMSNLSKHWNDMCNNMVSAAKNAASQINSAIQGIKDKVVHVTVERGGALAKGGLMSFAQGGMISAARGRLLTTSGPQVYTIGDNPGGHESVWAIPHNNPFPTMNKIDKFYGRGSRSGSSGETTFNQNVVLHISGNDIINEMKLNKKIRFTMGESMDRFG